MRQVFVQVMNELFTLACEAYAREAIVFKETRCVVAYDDVA